jgi:hypothetical protein
VARGLEKLSQRPQNEASNCSQTVASEIQTAPGRRFITRDEPRSPKVRESRNRRLNQAIHVIAVCQARSDPRGKAYYRKKLAEGKSCKEAMRCLKRRVSDAVFKALVADSVGTSLAVA